MNKMKKLKKSDPNINHDTLVEILVRLPLKNLIRLTLVSKLWNNLITNDSTFHRSLISNQKQTALGLLIQSDTYSSGNRQYVLHYHPFSLNNYTPFQLDPQGYRLTAQQSCNGLLLCPGITPDKSNGYVVCNLTTKNFRLLPEPFSKHLIWAKPVAMSLAFDPTKSPYYKVVALMRWAKTYQILTYSSDTGKWRSSGDPFPVEKQLCYRHGVYWNGSVHWINPWHENSSYYFNVESEMLLTMPSVPMNKSTNETNDEGYEVNNEANCYYVGESGGHLYYVETGFKQLEVYEMMTDYSNWIVKYNVCLPTIFRNYSEPSIVAPATHDSNEGLDGSEMPYLDDSNEGSDGSETPYFDDPFASESMADYSRYMYEASWPRNPNYREVSVLSVVCGEDEDDVSLFLRAPARVIKCSLVSNTGQKIHDIHDSNYNAFQYVESFCSV